MSVEKPTMIDNVVMVRITAIADPKAQFCVTVIEVYIMTETNLFPQSPPTMSGMTNDARVVVYMIMDPERIPGILRGKMIFLITPMFLDPQILADSIKLSAIF